MNATSHNKFSFKVRRSTDSDSSLIADDEEPTASQPSKSNRHATHLIEKYFVVKDAALILPRRSSTTDLSKYLVNINNSSRSNSKTELSSAPASCVCAKESEAADAEAKKHLTATGDILIHLQYMISLLRPNDTIILAVKLFSYVPERVRYLVIVETDGVVSIASSSSSSSEESSMCEECAILGFDLQPSACSSTPSSFACSIGLAAPIFANCELSLDGDGGFKFKSHHSTHIFKPVSIQAMWSAYQYLHKSLENARKCHHYSMALASSLALSSTCLADFESSHAASSRTEGNHEWVKYYSSLIGKNKATEVINEWYQKEERGAQREDFTTPYFDCLQLCKEQEVSF